MSDSVFFSWQSDVDEAVTKTVIRKAIQRAIKQVNREIALEDAERNALEYNSDTMGETGNPSVIDTICSKIDNSAAFVADVTYVATVEHNERTKGLPNANVMIEYGYALKALHSEKEEARKKTILIMNTAFGMPPKIELPFDLSHLRWPIQYELPSRSTDDEKKQAVDYLTDILKNNLRKLCRPLEGPDMPVVVQLKSVSQHNEINLITRCESMDGLLDKKIQEAKEFSHRILNQSDERIVISRGNSQFILDSGVARIRSIKNALQHKASVYEKELEQLKTDSRCYTNFRQKNAVECYIAVSNIGNVTLTDVRVTIELPDWLIAYRSNMARALPRPIDISTQHGNWQVIGGDYPKNKLENESNGDIVRVQFQLLTLDTEKIGKRRDLDASEPSDAFTLLALPHGKTGPCSLKIVVDAEEFDNPLLGMMELEIV